MVSNSIELSKVETSKFVINQITYTKKQCSLLNRVKRLNSTVTIAMITWKCLEFLFHASLQRSAVVAALYNVQYFYQEPGLIKQKVLIRTEM